MVYEKDGKLFLRTDDGFFYEVVVTGVGSCVEVHKIGERRNSRPQNAKKLTLQEVIAKYHVTDGVSYPVRKHTEVKGVKPLK